MAPSRRQSNGRSPLVNQQRQITSFFSKSTSLSPSSISSKPKRNPNSISDPKRSSSPSPCTPSPCNSKPNKPLLLIGASPVSPLEPVSIDKQSDGEDVVGRRIKVYWPLDKAWYEGCVKSFDKATGKHLIQYDDDEEESLELAKEKIEWVRDSVKKLKRLRRGFSPPKQMVIEDDELAENVDEESGDDSSDEDWGRNANEVVEVAEDHDEDMELDEEEEEDEDDVAKSSKGNSNKVKSRKRKLGGAEKLGSAKKSKTGGEVGKGSFKISSLEPKISLKVEKQSNGIDNVATGDGNERFASREAQKFRFLRE